MIHVYQRQSTGGGKRWQKSSYLSSRPALRSRPLQLAMRAVVELQGLHPEHPSARADLLPDIRVPLISHRAICSERTAACAAIQALRALPLDIDSRIMRITWRIIRGDGPNRGRFSWRPRSAEPRPSMIIRRLRSPCRAYLRRASAPPRPITQCGLIDLKSGSLGFSDLQFVIATRPSRSQ